MISTLFHYDVEKHRTLTSPRHRHSYSKERIEATELASRHSFEPFCSMDRLTFFFDLVPYKILQKINGDASVCRHEVILPDLDREVEFMVIGTPFELDLDEQFQRLSAEERLRIRNEKLVEKGYRGSGRAALAELIKELHGRTPAMQKRWLVGKDEQLVQSDPLIAFPRLLIKVPASGIRVRAARSIASAS